MFVTWDWTSLSSFCYIIPCLEITETLLNETLESRKPINTFFHCDAKNNRTVEAKSHSSTLLHVSSISCAVQVYEKIPIGIWLLAARIEEFETDPIQFQVCANILQEFGFIDLLVFASFMIFRIVSIWNFLVVSGILIFEFWNFSIVLSCCSLVQHNTKHDSCIT
ncbi:hypothetical protein RchiOBHm_Chr4g0390401 [Rosa chinensis]|uniref:Uncharacterized protein n=1 Tax=Rosa chinensis TaxID=74649 RepID=A0A2P6QQ93_ROSCH|nr:hypothetical protein RchiOBHm_Chr4g0390401 [Rosa chinensis]